MNWVTYISSADLIDVALRISDSVTFPWNRALRGLVEGKFPRTRPSVGRRLNFFKRPQQATKYFRCVSFNREKNRNHANETARKYLAISLLSTSIHSEHAAISCEQREHSFDFEPLHDVCSQRATILYLSREYEETRKKTKRMRYTPIEREFLVAADLLLYSDFLLNRVSRSLCNTIASRTNAARWLAPLGVDS